MLIEGLEGRQLLIRSVPFNPPQILSVLLSTRDQGCQKVKVDKMDTEKRPAGDNRSLQGRITWSSVRFFSQKVVQGWTRAFVERACATLEDSWVSSNGRYQVYQRSVHLVVPDADSESSPWYMMTGAFSRSSDCRLIGSLDSTISKFPFEPSMKAEHDDDKSEWSNQYTMKHLADGHEHSTDLHEFGRMWRVFSRSSHRVHGFPDNAQSLAGLSSFVRLAATPMRTSAQESLPSSRTIPDPSRYYQTVVEEQRCFVCKP